MIEFIKNRSDFTRNVIKILTGSAAAHAVIIVVTPILTRMFSQENIGALQIYVSTVLTFGVVSSLKYEMAIVLPKDDEEANVVAVLSLLVTTLFSLFFTGCLFLWGRALLTSVKAQILIPYLPSVAVGVYAFGLWQALQYLMTRRKAFGFLATNRLVQAVVAQGLAVLFGIFLADLRTLLIMQIVGWLIASFMLLIKGDLNFRVTYFDLLKSAKKYSKFPTINTAMVFINTFSLQLPVFMISHYFSPDIVALYTMANRVVNIPLFLVGRSIRQVYFQSASEAYHQSAAALFRLYTSTVKKLSLIAIIPLTLILLFGPFIARTYLGTAYQKSGVYMQIITFWMFFQFVNSPVSTTMTVLNRQEFGLILVLFSLLIRFITMVVFSGSPVTMLAALSLVTGLFYCAFNLTMHYLIRYEMRIEIDEN